MPQMSPILEELRRHSPLFVTQLAARTQVSVPDVTKQLNNFDERTVLVIEHTSPDRHIIADLRIASYVHDHDVARAVREADQLWSEWLRNMLQMHRCA